VKTRNSTSRELIFGRSGRPLGPNSGLDLGRRGGGRGGSGGGGEAGRWGAPIRVSVEHGKGDQGEEEMDALEERHQA
jgi:hypothetical protein